MRISVLGCGWLGLPVAGALAADGYRSRAEALGLEPPTFSEEPAPTKRVSSRKIRETLGYAFRHRPTV